MVERQWLGEMRDLPDRVLGKASQNFLTSGLKHESDQVMPRTAQAEGTASAKVQGL